MYDAVLKKSYYVKKKKSVSRKLLLSIFILFTILLITINIYGSRPVNYNIITIKKGDTLWSLASRFNSNNMDLRKIINEIKKLNNLEDVVLQPGQKLMIPDYK